MKEIEMRANATLWKYLGLCLATFGISGFAIEGIWVRSLAGGALLQDYECTGGNSQRSSGHPCRCFTHVDAHPWDVCEYAIPTSPWVTNNNEILDTSCISVETKECGSSSGGTAHSCGDVKACKLKLKGPIFQAPTTIVTTTSILNCMT